MQTFLSFVKSPRFLSFIGHAGAIGAVAILNDVGANLNVFNFSPIVVTVIGLIIAQLVGGLNKWINGEPTGFVKTSI